MKISRNQNARSAFARKTKLTSVAVIYFILVAELLSNRAWSADFITEPIPQTASRSSFQPPPTPPPTLHRQSAATVRNGPSLLSQAVPSGLTLYSIGNPTDEEQLYLEFLNRARADPPAEGLRFQATTDPDLLQDFRFFGVNLSLLASQFAAISSAAPLSLNSNLTAAARLHSKDMLDNQFQGHDGTDGSSLGDRATAQNYDWTTLGENVYSYARSVTHGHAGFNVDWGGDASTGGMQSPPGHRVSIHNPGFREVGIGVVHGTNGRVGPQLVTQDFGVRRNLDPLVTGVVYYDLNANNFYDIGEGIEGVTVLATGSQFYSLTPSSGGYSVPVSGSGAHTVTFRVPGLPEVQRIVMVTNSSNVKIDFLPAYVAPVISGPDRPTVARDNAYAFTAVGGAKSYQWKHNRRVPFTEAEGAEAGLAKMNAVTSAGYDAVTSTVKASGNNSFHLAHPSAKEDQFLTLNRVFKPGPASQLLFSSRLGWATSQQVARTQVSVSGVDSWQDVWSQAGTGGRGETLFIEQSVSLAPFAGQEIRLRFVYDYLGGNFFPQTDPDVGFYIDDIEVTDAEELLDEVIADVPSGTAFVFNPGDLADYSLSVRAKVADRFLAWGPERQIRAQAGEAPQLSLRITAIQSLLANRVQIDFEVANSSAASYGLESSSSITGPWTVESSATIQPLVAGTRFRAVAAVGSSSSRFYRVSAR